MYDVLLSSKAERDLKRLPVAVFHRIIPEIEALANEPRPPRCRKLEGSKRDYRIRVGQYRVVYEIDEKAKTVRVMRVRHRRDAYR
jgi:mRNA interferase RelE/StbE